MINLMINLFCPLQNCVEYEIRKPDSLIFKLIRSLRIFW